MDSEVLKGVKLECMVGGDFQKEIVLVGGSSPFSYCALLQDAKLDLVFHTSDRVQGEIYLLSVLSQEQPVELDLQLKVEHSGVNIKIHLVSLVFSEKKSSVAASIVMAKGVAHSECHLMEEILLLNDQVKVKALPILDIHTNDIVASHGAKIHKISSEFLFYLQSRGFSYAQAQGLMINSYFERLFSFHDFSEEGKSDFLSSIDYPLPILYS